MTRQIDEIDYPKDAAEWWLLVGKHALDLRRLVEKYHPWYSKRHRHEITAGAAEVACERIRQEIHAEEITEPVSPADRFDAYVATKDKQLDGVFQSTWFGMPESMDVHSEPGFGVLCDLCSESNVLGDEDT